MPDLERISKPDYLRSYARQSVDFPDFVHRLATVATVLKCALGQRLPLYGRLSLWLLALSIGSHQAAWPAVPLLPAESSSQPTKAGNSTGANKLETRDLNALRTEVDGQLRAVQQRLDATVSANDRGGQRTAWQRRLAQLKYLDLLYAQQQGMQEELLELRKNVDETRDGLTQSNLIDESQGPPYSFLYLEDLRDQWEDEKSIAEVLKAELVTAQKSIEIAQDDQARKERERRHIKEQLDVLNDAADSEGLRSELKNAEFACQIRKELVCLRKVEMELKKCDLELRQNREQILQRAIDQIQPQTRFSANDLKRKMALLDGLEGELQAELTQTQEDLQKVEQLRDALKTDTPDATTIQAEKADSVHAARESLHQKISQIQQMLADMVIVRECWNLRFKMHNQRAEVNELQEWLSQATDLADHFREAQRIIQIRLDEARLRLATTWKQLKQLPSPEDPRGEWMQLDYDATSRLVELSSQRLQALQLSTRSLNRFVGELTETLRPHTTEARIANFQAAGRACWDYELFAVDDRPVTVGKVISGILLLLGGVLASRVISRIIGRRVLPRMGVADGASLALQTILFYGLVSIFGLVTLELINIPITVFTFFGGAAAIAIGFGSQNILNNFMSGLILLSEQPIRIGDLVEIDGLTGSIERIGARSTKLRTGSNVEFIIPNSKFLDNSVTNWTLSNTEIRVCVKVGVAYGSSPHQVISLLRQATQEVPQVLKHRDPIILFTDFGDNALHFEAHFWIQLRTEMDGRRAESAVRERMDALLREANITIAFPQRDVHLDLSQPIELKLPDHSESFPEYSARRRAG